MPDREYVIKCLKYLHDRETWKEGPGVYDDKAANRRQITADALALLQEQEPVARGKWSRTLIGSLTIQDGFLKTCFKCSECNGANLVRSNFCPNCGVRMEVDE